MPELGPYGSVRGARGNSRPYRDPRPIAVIRCFKDYAFGWGKILELRLDAHHKRAIASSFRETGFAQTFQNVRNLGLKSWIVAHAGQHAPQTTYSD